MNSDYDVIVLSAPLPEVSKTATCTHVDVESKGFLAGLAWRPFAGG